MPRNNDYKRIFIMLRPLSEGCSMGGFCRIETREGIGQAIFSVHGAQEDGLRGVLFTKDSAADCGALRCMRGQGTLVLDIAGGRVGGNPLGAYTAAGIITDDGLMLLGDIGREHMDARAAVRLANIYNERSVKAASLNNTIAVKENIKETKQHACPSGDELYPTFGQETPDTPSAHSTAPETRPYDTAGAWEGVCAQLKGAFERAEQCGDLSQVPDTQFKRMALPVDVYGMDYYLLGVRFRLGSPKALCYAVPGAYRPFPPPGLEGYRWRASDDGSRGYWLSWLDAVTGEPISI